MKLLRMLLLVLTLAIITACGNDNLDNDREQPVDNSVKEFAAIDQSGNDFNVTDLEGKWWIADFIFTNCETVCIPMTNNMVKLQEKLADAELDDVNLVSFSIDPDFDTPEVLTEYANDYGANLDNWTFLTGYDFETIQDYAQGTFKNLVQAPPEGDDQVVHATYFFLINPDGNIVQHFPGMEADSLDQIVEAIQNNK